MDAREPSQVEGKGSRGLDVSAVIVTYNSRHVIVDLLDSLPAAADGLNLRVIVVDNGSTDGTIDVLRQRTDCELIESTNGGYAAGFMKGLAATNRFDAVAVLNPDVRLAARCLSYLMESLSLHATGIVAPRIHNENGSLFRSLRREPSLLRAAGLNWTRHKWFSEYVAEEEVYSRPAVVDWALGAVLLISRECMLATGGMDPSFFLYSEETDLCLRARDLGFVTRYEPRALAVHIGGQSGRNERTHAMQILNRVRLYRRRHGAIASWAYYVLALAREVSWVIRGVKRSRFAAAALLRPERRPPELGCSVSVMPR